MSEQTEGPVPLASEDGLSSGLGARRGAMLPATWGWLLALLGWTILLSFYDLGGGAAFEPIDCWVAQTAREMQDAGEWLVPRFSGEMRMQKSPGPYWTVMLTSRALGRPVDEVAARIPNAVAGLLLVLTVFWLTRRIAGDRAAVFAGFAIASSAFILHWSHRGASDLGLTALTTISLAALWVAYGAEPAGRKRTLLVLLAYFAAGCGMLYKMPMPLACVGVPAFCYVLLRNRWRVLASPIHLLGILLFLLPWLPWAIMVTQVEPTAWAKWKVEFLDRFTGDLPNVEEQKHWRFYFSYLLVPLVFCVPYSLSLPGALWRGLRRDPRLDRDGMLCMVIWFASLLAFFTASTGKEWRYFLPALPPLFVLLGVELSTFFDPKRQMNRTLIRVATVTACAGVPAGFVIAGYVLYTKWMPGIGVPSGFAWDQVWPPLAGAAVIFTLGTWIAARWFVVGRRNASFGALVATMFATWLWVWPRLMPIMVSQAAFVDMADQMRTRLTPEMRANLYQIGSQDPRITWNGDVRFPRLIDQLELLEMQEGERSLARETRLYAREMIRRLGGEDLTLLVIPIQDYVRFRAAAPVVLAAHDREMPETHIWLLPRCGPLNRYFVVFGNHAPPWDEPELPETLRTILDEARQTARDHADELVREFAIEFPTTQPTDQE